MTDKPDLTTPPESILDPEKFTDAQAGIAFKTGKVREQNAKMSAEIQSMGVNIDVSVARVEQALQHLAEWGIITVDQWLEQAKDWELHLRPQLQDVLGQVRAQVEEVGRQQRMAALTQGVPPGGVPNGAPRPKRPGR